MASAQATTAESLRVVQLVPILKVGGLERVATTLAVELSRRVERVVVCSKGGEPFEPVLRAQAITVVRIPRPKPQLRMLVRSAVALAPVLRRERPHVVHAHNPGAAIAASLACRLAFLPDTAIVTTYHGVMPTRVERAARVMEAVSDVVVGVGPASTDALLRGGLRPEKARTIHNAVAPEPARSRADVRKEFDAAHAELLVSVGRYAREKNQALLLEAVAQLAPERPRLRLLLVGDGPTEDELREHVRRLGLDSIATVTGERSDAVDITAAADAFVLSSDHEGLPLALLEALSLGTPVVTTDAGGVRDAIVDGETGLVVPVGDASALARGVARLLDDAELRERVAEAGRAHVARTSSPAAMADAYVDLYLDVAARKRARR